MLRTMLAAILAIGFSASVFADDFDNVRREAQAAFAKLDSEVAELEAQRQAEFRLLVRKELTALDLELRQAYGDSLAKRAMGIVGEYTEKLLEDNISNPEIKAVQFADLIARAKMATGLVEVETNKPEEPYGASRPDEVSPSPEPEVGEEQSHALVPFFHFTLERILQAKDGANWSENIRDATVPAKKRGLRKLFFWRESYPVWRERARQVWTSPDGKVTFAVGLGVAGPMGEEKAELDARNILARIGHESARVVVAELVGTMPVGYYRYKYGTVLCLMAVPTVLLPQEVER